MKIYEFPDTLSAWVEKYIRQLGFNLASPKPLAEAIMQVSNNYQNPSSVTDWRAKATQAAYLAYFFPLNYIRSLKVIDEAKKFSFFTNLNEFIDYGCGPGTFSKAIMNDPDILVKKITGLDTHPEVGKFFLDQPRKQVELHFNTTQKSPLTPQNIVLASYVFNELKSIPDWVFQSGQILLLEPSTKQASSRFQSLRCEFIDRGYEILAPCPHQNTCPLSLSQKDWCHDRVHWHQPIWFEHLEQHLPIKNKTLTFSYLIARRAPPLNQDYTRVVGDPLIEKGKTRWLICRSPQREFISFLKREGKPPQIFRGDRLKIHGGEKKSSELRLKQKDFKKL